MHPSNELGICHFDVSAMVTYTIYIVRRRALPLPNLGHDESNVSLWMSKVPIVTSTTLTTLLAHFHEFIHSLVLLGLSIVQFL
jgi:hypothetical protein